MKNFPDKPKNDFEFYYNDRIEPTPVPAQQRGGCLTAYLIYLIFGNLIALAYFMSEASNILSSSEIYLNANEIRLFLLILIPVQLAIIAFAIALWKWKRWGYYGLRFGYGISLIFNLLGGNLIGVVGSVIGLVFLVYLVGPVKEMLE